MGDSPSTTQVQEGGGEWLTPWNPFSKWESPPSEKDKFWKSTPSEKDKF